MQEVVDECTSETAEYRREKKMPSDIFKYLVEADVAQQAEMQLMVEDELQEELKY